MSSRLGQIGAGTEMQLGKMWTALIVVQVAFAVAVLTPAVFWASRSIELSKSDPGFAAHEFVVARLVMDRDTPPSATLDAYLREFNARYEDRFVELMRRIEKEPGISDVTSMSREPGDEPDVRIEIEAGPPSTTSAAFHRVRYARVAPDFFEAFDVPTLAGRRFDSSDLGVDRGASPERAPASRRVIVNRTFAKEVLGDSNPLGRRLRYADPQSSDDPRPWYEIVGVVGDLPAHPISPDGIQARLYHPMAPGADYGTQLAVRVRSGNADKIGARLRELTLALDPTLRLTGVMPLTDSYRQEQMGVHWGALALALVTLSVLLLAAAGIYALMSFTVTRRRREIGIRVALGADQQQILRSICARALAQLSGGIAAGMMAAMLLDAAADGELMGGHAAVLLPIVSVIMVAVGLLAAVGPARRGLRIDPTEALRAE